MENFLYYSFIIAILFFLIKYIQSKYSEKEKEIKELVKDTFVVFLACVIGINVFDYLKNQLGMGNIMNLHNEPIIFTDSPEF